MNRHEMDPEDWFMMVFLTIFVLSIWGTAIWFCAQLLAASS